TKRNVIERARALAGAGAEIFVQAAGAGHVELLGTGHGGNVDHRIGAAVEPVSWKREAWPPPDRQPKRGFIEGARGLQIVGPDGEVVDALELHKSPRVDGDRRSGLHCRQL